MADGDKIEFILTAIDEASDKFGAAADNFGAAVEKMQGDTKALQGALAAAGAVAAGFLAVSFKGFADQEQAITNTARVLESYGNNYEDAKSKVSELSSALEKQGFSTEKTTEAITLLVTKGGRDLPTALNEAADFMAAAEARGISLQQGIKALNREEGEGKLIIDGANAARQETLTTNEKLSIASERFGNILNRIGELLAPLIEKGLDFVTALLDGFEKLDPGMQNTILVLGTIIAVITTVVGTIAALMLALAPVISALATLGVTVGSVITFLTGIATTIGAVIAAIAAFLTGIGEILLIIAAVIAAIVLLKTAWDENWFGIQETVNNVVLAVTGFITNLLATISNFGAMGVIAIQNFVTQITAEFNKLISDALKWGSELVDNILKGIQQKASEIANAAASAAGKAAKALIGGSTGLVATGVTPLAEGGIISKPTLAVLGEGGENEYVIPESKMKNWMGGGKTIQINNYISGVTDPVRAAELASEMTIRKLNGSNADVMVSSRV